MAAVFRWCLVLSSTLIYEYGPRRSLFSSILNYFLHFLRFRTCVLSRDPCGRQLFSRASPERARVVVPVWRNLEPRFCPRIEHASQASCHEHLPYMRKTPARICKLLEAACDMWHGAGCSLSFWNPHKIRQISAYSGQFRQISPKFR